jgi:hypothetical protein
VDFDELSSQLRVLHGEPALFALDRSHGGDELALAFQE